jgi:hypothetical protein
MKKLAIFVEGQTEQIFVESLLFYLTRSHDISVEKKRGFGGKNNYRHFITLSSPDGDAPYYILIIDCSNDGRVLTDIRDEYDGLMRQNYDMILGLRDIYPHSHSDFRKLRRIANNLMPDYGPVKPIICFAVLEIETWFIAETSHFRKINPRLTRKFIKKMTGIDPFDQNLETSLAPENNEFRNSPASELNRIYKLVKRSYTKKRKQVTNLVRLLNMQNMVHEVPKRIHSLGFFIRQLEDFFESVKAKRK